MRVSSVHTNYDPGEVHIASFGENVRAEMFFPEREGMQDDLDGCMKKIFGMTK